MSVLLAKRSRSKVEFITKAIEIETRTLNLLSRLSNRYGRLLADKTMEQAIDVVVNVEKANSVFVKDASEYNLRKEYLLKARASLSSLDVLLCTVFDTLRLNPQGAFTTSTGKSVSESDATRRLDSISLELGQSIEQEFSLIKGVLDSDKVRYQNMLKTT